MFTRILFLPVVLALAAPALGESLWDETKAAAGSAVEIAGETVQDVANKIEGDEEPVTETRKMSLMITTGFGSGVAVAGASGERTYMKIATGGLNLGQGARYLRIGFLFPDEVTFSEFVETGWRAGAEADALAGQDATDAALRLEKGITVYELNEKGAMLGVTLTGTKCRKDDELNLQPVRVSPCRGSGTPRAPEIG